MPVTLRDLANACAVDTSTVSRALRDDGRVAPATRDKVKAEAARLGYHPNLAARNLVTGRTHAVWFLAGGLEAPQNHQPATTAAKRVREGGSDLLVAVHHGDRAAHERLLLRLRQHLCDGALVIADRLDLDSDLLVHLHTDGFPLVFVDRHRADLAVPAVSSANAEAAAELVRRAAADGATTLVNLFHPGGNTVEDARLAGLTQAAGELGLPVLGPDADLPAAGWAAFASSEIDARHWARSRALRLHRAGVFDAWHGDLPPGAIVHCAEQDFAAMGALAADLLLDLIAGRPVDPGLRLVPIAGIQRRIGD